MKKYSSYFLLIIIIPIISCNEQKQQENKNGTISAGKFNLYYERIGKGDAILLLHAGLQDHTMWEEQVNSLSKQYEVITADLPFHGNTTGYDTTIFVEDVIKILLDSLHLQKVSVAGLSMGGGATLDFVIAYPQRVNKAILISAGVTGYEKDHPIDSASSHWYKEFSNALEQKDTAKAAAEFTKAWAEGIYRSSDSLKAPVSRYIYKKTLESLRSHKMAGWPLLQDNPPAIEKLSGIQIPVLIINGDKDLPYITAGANYMEKNIPGSKHVVMKDVAHMLNLEDPKALDSILIDFLKK